MRLEEFARIDELAGIKQYNPAHINNLAELERFMAQFGFTCLDGGEFSRVFENPKLGQVVKVYNDECYDQFIALCKANTGNPHLPRFKGNSIRLRPDARMIRIERLTPMGGFDEFKAEGIYTMLHIAKDRVFNVEPGDWEVPPESESLLKAFELICANLQENKCWIDIGQGNMMKRGNTLVILDPYAPHRQGWASTHRG